MLSKLVTRQVFNHGLRLTKRTAAVAAQQKVVGNRNPEIKYQKVRSMISVELKEHRFLHL